MSISGGDKLAKYLQDIGNRASNAEEVRVGFLEGAKYPDGTSVPMVAAIQEYGAPSKGIPPRPFFRNTVAAHGDEWPKQLGKQLEATGFDAELALSRMGMLIGSQVRDSIINFDGKPNSPVTNLLKYRFPKGGQTFDDVLQAREDVAKGKSAPAGHPLIQSGDMLNSVEYQVDDGSKNKVSGS